jgi:OmpA-OmpF porin, OOP family
MSIVLILAGSAQALSAGAYVAVESGASFVPDRTIEGLQLPTNPTTGRGAHPGVQPGIAGIVAAGHAFGNGLRVELEGNIRSNGLNGSTHTQGTELKYGMMANVYYDIDLSFLGTNRVVPYVGAGVGWNHTNWNDVVFPQSNATLRVNSGVDSFAYQLMAGAAVPITGALSFTAEYRFFSIPGDQKFATSLTTRAGSIYPALLVSGENSQTIMLGLRYTFLSY